MSIALKENYSIWLQTITEPNLQPIVDSIFFQNQSDIQQSFFGNNLFKFFKLI